MKNSLKSCLLVSLLGLFLCSSTFAAAPPGWVATPFGEDQLAGSVAYDTAGGGTNITLEAEGNDVWGTADYGWFAFTPMAGDCEIIATIPIIPTNTADYGQWARALLMMRGSTMHGGQNIAVGRARG